MNITINDKTLIDSLPGAITLVEKLTSILVDCNEYGLEVRLDDDIVYITSLWHAEDEFTIEIDMNDL